MVLGVVEWSQILEVIWVSLVAGVGSTAIFSLVVFGTSRATEARRQGNNPAAFGALAVVGMIAFLGIVVFAITVILHKD